MPRLGPLVDLELLVGIAFFGALLVIGWIFKKGRAHARKEIQEAPVAAKAPEPSMEATCLKCAEGLVADEKRALEFVSEHRRLGHAVTSVWR